jgi:hypothetical protein
MFPSDIAISTIGVLVLLFTTNIRELLCATRCFEMRTAYIIVGLITTEQGPRIGEGRTVINEAQRQALPYVCSLIRYLAIDYDNR